MTAFGVFWGLFLLVILLGGLSGLRNGFVGSLAGLPGNSVFLVAQPTTMPYEGFERDREWHLSNADLTGIEKQFRREIKGTAAMNFAGSVPVTSANSSSSFEMAGVTPAYIQTLPFQVTYGRFINDIDIKQRRKVCVLGQDVYEKLYAPGVNPCGNEITVGDLSCMVVGVIKKTNNSIYFLFDENQGVFMPLTTQQMANNKANDIDLAVAILKDGYSSEGLMEDISAFVKQRHSIHPDDQQALMTADLGELVGQYATLFDAINLLAWIVGLGSLMAGLIGVSNIMLITVRERTQEIGVRRALGALPRQIVTQIMAESFVLTSIAGFAGIVTGTALIYVVRRLIEGGINEDSLIGIPQVPFETAMAALLIMILGSVLAGLLPVKRALSVKAIDALREE